MMAPPAPSVTMLSEVNETAPSGTPFGCQRGTPLAFTRWTKTSPYVSPARKLCQATTAPPAPSGTSCGYVSVSGKRQRGTPFWPQVAAPVASRCWQNTSPPLISLRWSCQATMYPQAPSDTILGRIWLAAAVQTGAGLSGSVGHASTVLLAPTSATIAPERIHALI